MNGVWHMELKEWVVSSFSEISVIFIKVPNYLFNDINKIYENVYKYIKFFEYTIQF